MLSSILDPILNAPTWSVLLIVGLVVFAEDALFVGFVLPGETAAVLGGVAAHEGHAPLWAVGLTVIAAAILGDTVGFEVGRHLGPRILRWKVLEKRKSGIERAQDFLRRRGGWAVFLGRWTAFFRAVMPALAGTSKMHYPTFLAFNAAGGIAWSCVVVGIGYAAGASYKQVEGTFGKGAAAVVVLVVVLAVVVWKVREHRQDKAREASHA
ncbi:DedA family protein [Lapillicoccus jejuensis]|uniref:Membrane protein DedA with SNARE-associated domain n=1 Tax=Lapillicoccus jejuensis TaxID=402171 RepID=A0A542E5F0_9MICO|nr:DedA family protein [Lapillicoccus jejuensis]TQJ10499.1 membrane protein DedA with SNARE-associated domain [Lapillicoccus jejuensis]